MSAAYVAASALFVGNVGPILVGAVADGYRARPLQLGLINSCYMGVTLVVSGSAPFWINRVSWPWISGLAAVGIAVDFLFSSKALNIEAIYGVFLIAGLFSGLLSGPSNASLGFSSAPARWYGISMLCQNLAAGVFAWVVPTFFQPRFGPLAALTAMTVMYLPCIVVGWLIRAPVHRVDSGEQRAPLAQFAAGARRWASLYAAFVGTILIAASAVAYWLFLERMGEAAKIPASFVGFSIAVSSATGIVGALLAATAGRRLPGLFSVGLTTGIVSYLLMLVPGASFFLASACLFNFAWGLSMPLFQAIIRRADFTNRLFVASSATIFLAGVATGPLAGHVAELWGYGAVLYLCALSWIVALALGLYAYISARALPVHAAAAL